MKVVILAGGFGTRLSEYTDSIPKPMVPIGGKPIIEHIINIYQKYGHNDFVATGYKSQIIENYFKNNSSKSNIHLINTGSETLTGGRIKRLEKFLKTNLFLTYGDGVSDINLDNLLQFHKNNKKIVTVTAVRPPARFERSLFKTMQFQNLMRKYIRAIIGLMEDSLSLNQEYLIIWKMIRQF